MSSPAQRIQQLRDELNSHNHAYYVDNRPTISDYEYDMLMKELERLEKENPELDDPFSPTHRVGSDITKGFEQVAHERPMLSLSNTYSVEEVDDWVRRCNELLGNADGLKSIPIVGEMKFDGTSISLIYEHGRLVRAVTRGDGEKGDDVTENIKTIRSIPLVLHGEGYPEVFEIRGEIVLPWKAFDRLNEERAFNEEPLFANPRNAAAGTLKMQNTAEVSRRGLDAYFYYLLADELPCDNHYDNMLMARKWGFKVSHLMTLMNDITEVDDFIRRLDVERKELPVATDGLVFKVNNLRQQLNLGYTSKSPRWAIAYKFAAERALTRLRFVSFEVGRMGIVTPVANLEPVLLSGTIVKRASLHNEDIVKTLGIHEHDMLYVEKGGEIIPKITGVDEAAREQGAEPVKFVTHCPDCGTPLIRVPGEAAWQCPNKYGCRPQIIGRLEHFVGRHAMDINGVGEENAALLYDAGLVRNIADFYTLQAADLEALERVGPRTAQRILEGVEASKAVPFDRVVYSLSIPFVGETVARKLARGVGDMDTLVSMSRDNLIAIEDIGPKIADAIIEYFCVPSNKEIVSRLREAGVQMAIPDEDKSDRTDLLSGKTIVISGVFAKHSREEYKEMIEKNGGKNSGSISKKTSFVLAGENMGPAKLEKARSLGVPVIDENEFLDMIGK
ncbi:MAG: NAD-dependent DNA ligase LigA [Bacteroides sp.]|nr:NAD-dependent DNA ligase LigA [Bacteroides sp.]